MNFLFFLIGVVILFIVFVLTIWVIILCQFVRLKIPEKKNYSTKITDDMSEIIGKIDTLHELARFEWDLERRVLVFSDIVIYGVIVSVKIYSNGAEQFFLTVLEGREVVGKRAVERLGRMYPFKVQCFILDTDLFYNFLGEVDLPISNRNCGKQAY